jgi:hypothetical protein
MRQFLITLKNGQIESTQEHEAKGYGEMIHYLAGKYTADEIALIRDVSIPDHDFLRWARAQDTDDFVGGILKLLYCEDCAVTNSKEINAKDFVEYAQDLAYVNEITPRSYNDHIASNERNER